MQGGGAQHYSDMVMDGFTGATLSANWTENDNGGTVWVGRGVNLSTSAAPIPVHHVRRIADSRDGRFFSALERHCDDVADQSASTLMLSNGLPANSATDDDGLRSADASRDNNGFTVRMRTDTNTYISVTRKRRRLRTRHRILLDRQQYRRLGGWHTPVAGFERPPDAPDISVVGRPVIANLWLAN